MDHNSYGIRLTDTTDGRSKANMLISRMYAWRGYRAHELTDDPNRITLTATDKGEVVGTLSIGIDSPAGLMADQVYREELDARRARGARLCEVTRLAFAPSVRSKVSLANLFHLAVIYARDLHGCTDAVIEVNPRHRRFYQSMLGFQQLGGMKINARVNAPSYLLHIDLAFVTAQIEQHGGTYEAGNPVSRRSFYPYFFSQREERGIINRLLRMDEDGR